jgi:hypothetical protein
MKTAASIRSPVTTPSFALRACASRSGGKCAGNNPVELHRLNILQYASEGKELTIYSYGNRHVVGLAVIPVTDQLQAWVNARYNLGNSLALGYIAHIQPSTGRSLWITLVVHGWSLGSQPARQASRAEKQGRHSRCSDAAARRILGSDCL